MNRIRIVSRVVRYVILANIILSVGFWLMHTSPSSFSGSSGDFGRSVMFILLQVLLCVWFWKLAQLFHFYERGLIFASETIRCLKTLGLLCALNWLCSTITSSFFSRPVTTPPPVLPAGAKVVAVKHISLGFFSFNLGGIHFGMLLAGIVIVLIAWIMDEGRKIQEEQELTV